MIPGLHPSSPDWATLRRRSLEKIETWRRELESLHVAPDRAQQLRGMIFALVDQIDDVEQATPTMPREDNYA